MKKKRSPGYLKDHHCNLNIFNTSSRIKYLLSFVLSYNKLSPPHKYFVMSISSHVKPNTYYETVKYDYSYSVRYLFISNFFQF